MILNPDLIVANNDFSIAYNDWAQLWDLPMTPPREMGWYQRKKSRYFAIYNELATQAAKLLDIDPFWLTVQTQLIESFNVESEADRLQLAVQVEHLIAKLAQKYAQLGLDWKPVIFIKNNAGTYGLAVTQVTSHQQILEWTYRQRKKIKAAKSGRIVKEIIIQEGIPSEIRFQDHPAEHVIYMVGCQTVGSFYRYHPEKTHIESLNAPGGYFYPILNQQIRGQFIDWVAKIGLLAMGHEAQYMGVRYKTFATNLCTSIT